MTHTFNSCFLFQKNKKKLLNKGFSNSIAETSKKGIVVLQGAEFKN
jgi:hypothetical protein